MAFELSDKEAEEVYALVKRKLSAIEYVLDTHNKGARVMGKEKLETRQKLQRELVERLEKYFNK